MKKDNTGFQIPTGICLKAKRHMKQLMQRLKDNNTIIKSSDYGALELIAYIYHNLEMARERVAAEGDIVKEITARGNKVTKIHPAMRIQYECNSQLKQFMIEFGLTPKSRGVVNTTQGNLFDELPQELQKFRVVK